MKRTNLLALAAAILMLSLPSPAQNSATANSPAASDSAEVPAAVAGPLAKRVEAYLRNMFALGPSVDVQAGPVKMSAASDFYEVAIKITSEGQSTAGLVYVTKDGRYMFQGQIQDLNADPLADIRSQIHLDGYASKGPAGAKVTVVEFGDLECPSCRQFESVLRTVLPKYPQVRFVFKDFPLEQVHPWAKTAALAGHCALQQSEAIFWKFHDSIYDNQDLITVENAFDKLTGYAIDAGADPAAFKSCVIDPATEAAVTKSQEEGQSLGVSGTPTTFVNGRRINGPDQGQLEQYIEFDLNR